MELTHNDYIHEVDEEFQKHFGTKDGIEKMKENPGYHLSQIQEKYKKLPDKWRSSINLHLREKIFSLLKKENILKIGEDPLSFLNPSNHANNYNVGKHVVEFRATVITLMEDVEKLKNQVGTLMEELENQKKINQVVSSELQTLHKSFETFKRVGSDPTDDVRIIQRYWRRYVLLKNVKKYAKQYEDNLLAEFRKNLLTCSKPSNKPLEAAQRRMNPLVKKIKPGFSVPEEWNIRKAEQVARDWMN